MGIIEHLSRYFLVPPNEIFEERRGFYRDNLEGEDVHINLRELDETEREYRFLSRYLPTAADIGIGAVSLFTGKPSYLLLLAIPETWRMIEMSTGWLYNCYTRRLTGYIEMISEKNLAEIKKASTRHVDIDAQTREAVDEVFRDLDLDSRFPAQENASEVLSPEDINKLPEPEEDDCEEDSRQGDEPSKPWDIEDGDGWKEGKRY
ncbi:MAG: hypothetical protein HY512_00040 [Candidatus Aenigmarchaeota archaeon]|nr:hypothetical protein [Candidatus Aenigmarchaeota archaeon]